MTEGAKPRRVLVADASPTVRRIVHTVLGRAGHEVLEAADGVRAVQTVFAERPDVVLLDAQLPRLSGYSATRLLKEDWRTAHVPVILLTALPVASDRYWGAQTGADRVLAKDFQAPELVAAVAAVTGPESISVPPAEPVRLRADDVLSQVCRLLDRKLFETSVAAEVTALSTRVRGFEPTVAELLALLGRFVDYELAGVLLFAERTAYVSVAAPVTTRHYDEFLAEAASAAAAAGGEPPTVATLRVRLADPGGSLGAVVDDEFAEAGPMATFLSMLLRGHGGEPVGVLALSSAQPHAFGEAALATLQVVESPAAVVIDNARLAGAYAG